MKKLKIVIILFLLVFFTAFSFWDWVLWVDVGGDLDFIQNFLKILYLILWPFLVISWKFLSNTFVYGSSFWIDNVIFNLHHLIRVFSNYFIGIIFIVSIFTTFFKPNSKLNRKKTLPRIVIASVLINLSWFLVAFLIDLSSILISVAWSFWYVFEKQEETKSYDMLPLTFNTNWTWEFIKIKWKNWKTYELCIKNKDWEIQNQPCIAFSGWNYIIKSENSKEPIDWINISALKWDETWKLISLFQYMNWAFLQDSTNSQLSSVLIMIIKMWLLFVLIIPFILLSLILIVRVVILWVFIPLSPFLFAVYTLWIFDSQVKSKMKDIISIIFQPVYIVFCLSVGFIFIKSIHAMLPGNWKKQSDISNFFWITYEDGKSKDDDSENKKSLKFGKDDTSLFVIESVYNESSWWSATDIDPKDILNYFSWIVLNLFSAFVLWFLVFIAFKSNSFTKKISEPVDAFTKTALKNTKILPYWQSIESLSQTWEHIKWMPWQFSSSQYTNLRKSIKDDNTEEDQEED